MENGSYGPRWQGPALGLLATGAGLAAAELAVGLIRGSSSPVVPVGQVFIDLVPRSLKNWAVSTFGTNDKAVLVFGALIVVFGVGLAVGVLAMRGARSAAYALTAGVGVLGAFAVLTRPDPTLGKLMPTIVGTCVSIAVLWYLAPRPVSHASTTAGGDPTVAGSTVAEPMVAQPMVAQPMVAQPMGVDRRRFVVGAVGIGSAAVIVGGIGRLLQQRFEVSAERSSIALPIAASPAALLPGDATLPVDGLTPFVIPNNDFYRIDTALVVPQVSKESWSLTIGGMVDRPLKITFDDLLARPQVERYITLSCVSNPVGGPYIGNALWQGVLLKDLLDEAGVQQGATQVVSRSVDGWTAGTPTEVIMDGRDAMLAIAMNGEPLPAEHGYPVRMVVPGLYGYVSATKWLSEIELTRWEDYDAYWIPRGWSKLGPVKTMARIDTPHKRDHVGEVAVGGVAWAVHSGVSKVEVRVDDGDWVEAELGGVPSSDTWVQWVARIGPAPGKHKIEARAFDADGVPQTEEYAPVAPNGAQGYPAVTINVKSA